MTTRVVIHVLYTMTEDACSAFTICGLVADKQVAFHADSSEQFVPIKRAFPQ
jgi:hypothetical protein